jgi:hypothetical protein
MLLSAGTAARRETMGAHADQLGMMVDWSRLANLLSGRRLLPMLGPRIVELAPQRASGEFKEAVAGAVDAGRRQGAFLQLIAARTMDALAEVGIRSTALKGPLLGEALYGDLGRRPSSDIDLLVAEEQLDEAVEVVRKLGYAAPTDHVGDRGLPLLHFALVHKRDELPPVELHWRIHWYESQFARDRLLGPTAGLAKGWRPEPEAELAALLLFYARDGFIGLRHATDIGAWWDSFGAKLQPGALDELIAAYPALESVLTAAVRVAARTVGLPARRLVKQRARLGPRARIAVRLADPYPHSSQAQIYADMGLIDGLLTPPGGLRAFLRRQVTPPREASAEHMPGMRGRWARSTLGHSVRVLSRYGLAMTRLLWVPETARSR